MLIFSLLFATVFPGRVISPGASFEEGKMAAVSLAPMYRNFVEFSVFDNDSVSDVSYFDKETRLEMQAASKNVEAAVFSRACYQVVVDSLLYVERWDTLQQPKFWRLVMNLPKDTAVVNIAKSRTVIETMAIREWNAMGDSTQAIYKDSIRTEYELDSDDAVYVTTGKNHFYEFEKALPSIGRGIEVFESREVDPWYAQAILLIESPGKTLKSPVGAYGSFQLMREVAIEQGLIVNDSTDEREDFVKSAQAAASLLDTRCIPHIKSILRKHEIEFEESDIWFRLMVLHAYHAGAGNVRGVVDQINPVNGGMWLIQQMWQTQYGGFKNASQNYSQIALASFMELDDIMQHADTLCMQADLEAAL